MKKGWADSLLAVVVLALGLVAALSAESVMLVFNSGRATAGTPGRESPPGTPLTHTDDVQCGTEGESLENLEIYVARDDGTTGAVTDACTESGTEYATCGFDIEVQVTNSTAQTDLQFWIQSFTAGDPDYSPTFKVADSKLSLRVNGVKTTAGHALPVHVGTIALARGSQESETPDTSCPADCRTGVCASVHVLDAKVVKANLEMETLHDSVKLLLVPEPGSATLWWAGATLTVLLRRRRVVRRVSR